MLPGWKKNMVMHSVTRRGEARAAGRVGWKTTGISQRVQKVNQQKRTIHEHGVLKRVWLSVQGVHLFSNPPVHGIELA
ncbi:50S ribosomal protein L28 [Deinococcus hohokamensis]|uniref:50S ribosomal protein L28 n=1 Tax=Deinococcus hohokamensis TaxID=309883 RepID=A0ABV9IFW3_9DEIO